MFTAFARIWRVCLVGTVIVGFVGNVTRAQNPIQRNPWTTNTPVDAHKALQQTVEPVYPIIMTDTGSKMRLQSDAITNNETRSISMDMLSLNRLKGPIRIHNTRYSVSVPAGSTNWYRIAQSALASGSTSMGRVRVWISASGLHGIYDISFSSAWDNTQNSPVLTVYGSSYNTTPAQGLQAVRLVTAYGVTHYVDLLLANPTGTGYTLSVGIDPLETGGYTDSNGYSWVFYTPTNTSGTVSGIVTYAFPTNSVWSVSQRYGRAIVTEEGDPVFWATSVGTPALRFGHGVSTNVLYFDGGIKIGTVGESEPIPGVDDVSTLAIGGAALRWFASGYSPFAIGYRAGTYVTNASYLSFVGQYVGQFAENSSQASFFGYAAGQYATNALYSTFLGMSAGRYASDTRDAVFIGYAAGCNATNVDYSVLIGNAAGQYAVNAYQPVLVGYFAGCYASNAQSLVGVGANAGIMAYGADYSVFVGRAAGANAADSDYSVGIGLWSMRLATNADYTVAVGAYSLEYATNGLDNTAVGTFAGRYASNTTQSVMLGRAAGFNAFGSSQSTYVGPFAGQYAENSDFVTFVGANAGLYATNSGYNVFLGYNAGQHASNTFYNVFLGHNAGGVSKNLTNSIIIGANQGTNQAADSILWIHPGQSTTRPLIYGSGRDTNRFLWVNGDLVATGKVATLSGVFHGSAAGISNVPVSAISATGTPDSSTFLRGDGVWAAPGAFAVAVAAGPNITVSTNVTGNGTLYTVGLSSTIVGDLTFADPIGGLAWSIDMTGDASFRDVGVDSISSATGFWGSGAGLTNIPLSGLSQSGAQNGQVAVWQGAWMPTNRVVTLHHTTMQTTNAIVLGHLASSNSTWIAGTYVVPRATGSASVDTANIQYALDLATNNGAHSYGGVTEIVLQPGSYVVNTLYVKTHGTRIRGSGVERTRLVANQASAPVLDFSGVNGFVTWGGTNQLWWFELQDLAIYKTQQQTNQSLSAAVRMRTATPSSQRLSRARFSNIRVTGFWKAFDIEHAVGVLFDRVEAYGNNYAFWLEKVDSATFLNCFGGDAEDASGNNLFGDQYSAVLVYKPNSYAEGFQCVWVNGEARRAKVLWDVQGGTFTLIGGNAENQRNGPVIQATNSSYIRSIFISGTRMGRASGVTQPLIRLGSGVASRTFIQGLYPLEDQFPHVEVGGANDLINFGGGVGLIVSNAATARKFTLPNTGVADGGNFLVTSNLLVQRTLYATNGMVAVGGSAIVGNGSGLTNISVSGLSVSGGSEGKVVKIVGGVPAWANDDTGGGGSYPGVLATNYIWVSIHGDDAAGQRNNPAYPFKSLSAAYAASYAGDVIVVLPGTNYMSSAQQVTGTKPLYIWLQGGTIGRASSGQWCRITNSVTIVGHGNIGWLDPGGNYSDELFATGDVNIDVDGVLFSRVVGTNVNIRVRKIYAFSYSEGEEWYIRALGNPPTTNQFVNIHAREFELSSGTPYGWNIAAGHVLLEADLLYRNAFNPNERLEVYAYTFADRVSRERNISWFFETCSPGLYPIWSMPYGGFILSTNAVSLGTNFSSSYGGRLGPM